MIKVTVDGMIERKYGRIVNITSSADWMQRNMDWRVEVMVPITDEVVHAQILDGIMAATLKDTVQS